MTQRKLNLSYIILIYTTIKLGGNEKEKKIEDSGWFDLARFLVRYSR